jgi:hypothetical protein
VQRAEKKYLKEGEAFEQQRSEALKRCTELQKEIRSISPFKELRERYEDLSATQLIDSLHNLRPIPDNYLSARESFEAAVLKEGAPPGEAMAEILKRSGV